MILGACFLTLLVLLTLQTVSPSQIEDRVRRGQDALYSLDFEAAEEIFGGLIRDHPEDPTGYAFLSITLWNKLLQAAGNLALDDYATPTPFTRKSRKPVTSETALFKKANDRLIEVCDRRLSENPNDVLALYFKGVAFEFLAAEAVAIRKKHLEAWGHGRRATRLHRKVLQLDPDFVDAKLSIAAAEFTRAVLPWSIKWLTVLFFPGNKEAALEKLTEVIQKGRYRSLDARVLMFMLQSWKGDPKEAARTLDSLRNEYPSNYLLDLNLAAVYQRTLNNPKQALGIYLQLLDSLEAKAPGLGVGEVYYRVGTTYHRLREYGKALEALEEALKHPKNERETEALSSFMIALIHEEQGESEKAEQYYRRVIEKAPAGDALKSEVRLARRKLQ